MRQLVRLAVGLLLCAVHGLVPANAQSMYKAAGYPGGDASVKINACIAAVIAAGNRAEAA